MIQTIIILVIGILILRMKGSIAFVAGTLLVTLALTLAINMAIKNPSKISHKETISVVSEKTIETVRKFKDELDKELEGEKPEYQEPKKGRIVNPENDPYAEDKNQWE